MHVGRGTACVPRDFRAIPRPDSNEYELATRLGYCNENAASKHDAYQQGCGHGLVGTDETASFADTAPHGGASRGTGAAISHTMPLGLKRTSTLADNSRPTL